MTAQGKPRTRAEIVEMFQTPLMIAPLVIAVPLGWLLVELGVDWIASVIIALAYGLLGSYGFLAMSAMWAMDGRPTSAQAPPSKVRFVVGHVLANLMWLAVLPVVVAALLPVGLAARLLKSD